MSTNPWQDLFPGDPTRIYQQSLSPIGLFARQRWRKEDALKLRRTGEKWVDYILYRQNLDGSWNHSVTQTCRNLFHLWLLMDKVLEEQREALAWLLEKNYAPMRRISCDGAPYHHLFFKMSRQEREEMNSASDIPFNPGCSGFFKTGIAIFFASLLHQENEPRVEMAFQSLNQVLKVRQGVWCSIPCSTNILKAYTAHPVMKTSGQTALALEYLGKKQGRSGRWLGTPYFYHTLHAVAQSPLPSARKQVEKAIPALIQSQNPDGSWGKRNPELTTFLVLSALESQGFFSVQ